MHKNVEINTAMRCQPYNGEPSRRDYILANQAAVEFTDKLVLETHENPAACTGFDDGPFSIRRVSD